jgi:hypothetical protein
MTDMLTGYLPSFVNKRVTTTSRNKKQAIPDWIRTVLREGADKRNKLVHSPKGFQPRYQPSTTDVNRLIDAVHDLLYVLDWFRGFSWAREFLDEQTRDAYSADSQAGTALRPID